MKYHPIADYFPLLHGEEFDGLVESIRKQGQLEPIILHSDGRIIDGRNRWRACKKIGIDPITKTWDGEGDVSQIIIARNINRRHLNESQRALVAARFATARQGARTDLTSARCGRGYSLTNVEAAKAFGVGKTLVKYAKKILKNGVPELIERIESGDLSVSLCFKICGFDAKQQQIILAKSVEDISDLLNGCKSSEGSNHAQYSPSGVGNKPTNEIVIPSEMSEKDEKLILNVANRIVKERRRTQRNVYVEMLASNEQKIPKGKYHTILCDPPWDNVQHHNTLYPVVGADYPKMSHRELLEYREKIDALAFDDCFMFLWCTIGTLPRAMEILESWGFRYIFQMVWNKIGPNGNPTGFLPTGFPRYTHELVLVGKRGSLHFADTRDFNTSITAPRAEHSRKPIEFYKLIDRVCPKPIIDLFSRQDWMKAGLDIESHGLEVGKFSNAL